MNHRQVVWEALLDADYRARYYGHLASGLQRRERALAVTAAVLSSSSFVALISKIDVQYLPQCLALAAAVCSTVMATYRFGKTAALSGSFFKRWTEAKTELTVLWNQIDTLGDAAVLERWQAVMAKVADMNEIAPVEFPLKPRLAAQCRDEVLTAMHLKAA